MKEKLNQRELQALKRRREILLAAKKLFASKGFHATTTRSINSEAGIADGLLYHYFPQGKMQILETLMEEELFGKMDNYFRTLKEIKVEEGLENTLKTIGRAVLKYATRDHELLIIFLRENRLLKESILTTVSGSAYSLLSKMERIIQYYVDRGDIKELNTRFLIFQFISTFAMHVLQETLMGDDLVLEKDDEAFLELAVQQTLQTWKV